MNIFKKIKIFNKVTSGIKEAKEILDDTHLDDDIKKDIETIIACANDLKEKVPQLNGPINKIMEAFK